jgi:ABC-2 type transport system ATP-binding protein
VGEPHRAIPALLDELDGLNRPLASLTTRHVSLEDVFVDLTGRHLRDDTAEEVRSFNTGEKKRRKGARSSPSATESNE